MLKYQTHGSPGTRPSKWQETYIDAPQEAFHSHDIERANQPRCFLGYSEIIPSTRQMSIFVASVLTKAKSMTPP